MFHEYEIYIQAYILTHTKKIIQGFATMNLQLLANDLESHPMMSLIITV